MRWNYTIQGGVTSSPVVADGKVYIGSEDGWVYCLDFNDGSLAWRFCAAPNEQRMTSFEQVESVWPVNGSVLVINDLLFILNGTNGTLHQVAVSPDGYRELGRVQVLSGKEVWAPMAYTGGKLLMRDKQKLVCLDITAK